MTDVARIPPGTSVDRPVRSVVGRVPPHDLDAEAAVLSAVLLDASSLALVMEFLQTKHFYSDANASIYEAALALHTDGKPADIVSVAGWLRARGRLNENGGAAYLAQISDATPGVAYVGQHARAVVDSWRRRDVIATCQRVAAEGYYDVGDPDAYLAGARTALAEVLAPAAPITPLWKTPAQRAEQLGLRGVRLPTGFATLDRATRGGPLTGRVVVAGGAPGAGKTTFALQLGHHYVKQGHYVAIVAADEEADGLLIRWGQQEGLRRDDLEAGITEAREFLIDRLAELPNLMLIDQDEESSSLEAIVDELVKRANGRPAVLIVDSIQTVRAAGTDRALTPRDRVDFVVVALKRAAKLHGLLVIATSELARGAYRSKASVDQIEDLAAFKESGGIEYGVGLALVFRSVPTTPDTMAVTMPKNRLGEALGFFLRLDRRRAAFFEVETSPRLDEDEQAVAQLDVTCARVIAILRKDTTLPSANAIARRLGTNKSRALAAVKDLQERGAIKLVDGSFRVVAGVTSSPPRTPEASP